MSVCAQNAATRALFAAVSLVGVLALGAGSTAFAAPTTHTVVIERMAFVPEVLTVNKGDTVVWVNKDLFPHTATAQGGFDSHEIAASKTWRFVAKKAGRTPYICTLHPTMKGALIVR